jgi:hypothetical protein
MMIGLHVRSCMLVIGMSIGHAGIVRHRFVVVIVLCCRGWHTDEHRCGREALERHGQQRDPDDQDFQDGFHAVILA